MVGEIQGAEETEGQILESNIKSFLKSAKVVYEIKDFTSATILYFKALFSTLDLVILKKKGMIPKDHSERFRILKLEFLKLYDILDKIYPIYRNTYTVKIDKEKCDEVKKNVERITKEEGIFENN